MTHPDAPAAALTSGLHHLGLSVSDLPAAVAFFTDALGHRVVAERAEYPAVFVSDASVMITLWQAAADASAFDRRHQIGLHHLALRVADLEAVAARVAAHPGVAIEFLPQALGTGGTRHMMCAMPGGLRVEFIAPAAER